MGCSESQHAIPQTDKGLAGKHTFAATSGKNVTVSECDQFLQDYEGWVKNYIVLIKRFQQNPKDKTIIADYQEMVGQIGTWDKRSRTCIKDPVILKRYVELQEMLNDHAVKVVSN